MAHSLAIGIDLGTTTSLASVGMPDGRPRLLRDPQGQGIIPSVVSLLSDGRILVGQRARDRIVLDPEHTFFSTKRFMGRDMRLDDNSWAAAAYPFRVFPGENGVASVDAHGRRFTLTEVAAMILAYLKKLAEQALGIPVPRAVITVPANFNDVQRSTTRQAGELAGFDVLRIINEPTAAALAYGIDRSRDNERIAVYDFGGGTFDMTILEVRGQIYEVLATAGNTMLGGDDFDRRIFDRMVRAFQEQTGHHPRENQEFHQKLFLGAERLKCQLSDWLVAGFTEHGIRIGSQSFDFHFELSREQLNEACGDLVDMSFEVCDEVLRLADCTLTSIDQIILVGGTTRIPLLRERVTKYFLRPPLDKIQPDTVVSLGAAIQAFALAGGPAMWPSPTQVPLLAPPAAPEDATRVVPLPPEAAAEEADSTRVVSRAKVEAVARADARAYRAATPPVLRVGTAEVEPLPDDGPTVAAEDEPTVAGTVLPADEEPTVAAAGPPRPGMGPLPLAPPGVRQKAPRTAKFLPVVPAGAPPTPPASPAPLPVGIPPAAPPATPLPAAASRPAASPRPPTAPSRGMPDMRLTLEPPRGLGQPIGHPASPAGGVPLPLPPASAPPLAQEAMASILAGAAARPRPAPVLLDVTPMTLGIQTVGGNVEPIVPRNSQVPVEHSRLFATTADDQTAVVIRVCQGESRRIAENVVLGEMTLEDLPAMTRGSVAIRVTFEIDTDGIFSATAVDTKTGKAQRIRLTLFGG